MRISDWSSDVCSSDLQGRSPAAAHYARMIWLALFGLAHFYLIWFGDILFLYAMCGLLLFLFRNLSIRALLWWAAGFFLLAFALFFGLWSGLVAAASRSEEHTSELQSLMRSSYAVSCLKKEHKPPDHKIGIESNTI